MENRLGKAFVERGPPPVKAFLLINDPTLYHRLDSTMTNMNQLLVDLKENPVKYMRALRLVDIF